MKTPGRRRTASRQRAAHLEALAAATRAVNCAAEPRQDRHLSVEMSRAARTGRSLTVTVVAIDGFGAFAETQGRHAPDHLLGDFASALRSLLRDMDVIGRSGGEQFLLALPDCDRTGSQRIAGSGPSPRQVGPARQPCGACSAGRSGTAPSPPSNC